MLCRKFERKVSEYVDGILSDKEYQFWEKHIQHCPRCQETLRKTEKMISALSQLQDLVPSNDFHKKLRNSIAIKEIMSAESKKIGWFKPQIIPITVFLLLMLFSGVVYFHIEKNNLSKYNSLSLFNKFIAKPQKEAKKKNLKSLQLEKQNKAFFDEIQSSVSLADSSKRTVRALPKRRKQISSSTGNAIAKQENNLVLKNTTSNDKKEKTNFEQNLPNITTENFQREEHVVQEEDAVAKPSVFTSAKPEPETINQISEKMDYEGISNEKGNSSIKTSTSLNKKMIASKDKNKKTKENRRNLRLNNKIGMISLNEKSAVRRKDENIFDTADKDFINYITLKIKLSFPKEKFKEDSDIEYHQVSVPKNCYDFFIKEQILNFKGSISKSGYIYRISYPKNINLNSDCIKDLSNAVKNIKINIENLQKYSNKKEINISIIKT